MENKNDKIKLIVAIVLIIGVIAFWGVRLYKANQKKGPKIPVLKIQKLSKEEIATRQAQSEALKTLYAGKLNKDTKEVIVSPLQVSSDFISGMIFLIPQAPAPRTGTSSAPIMPSKPENNVPQRFIAKNNNGIWESLFLGTEQEYKCSAVQSLGAPENFTRDCRK